MSKYKGAHPCLYWHLKPGYFMFCTTGERKWVKLFGIPLIKLRKWEMFEVLDVSDRRDGMITVHVKGTESGTEMKFTRRSTAETSYYVVESTEIIKKGVIDV
ncbi:hypothetical protein SHANETTE_39 [Bacillus phage Shanette]|uniref:Uncharacterized protein n=2 Tax=Siminovitchvirus TaxID=1918721 RepID=S5MM33_9CAUD|nr:hypothetical protein AVV47_gp041 [Bacillus phage JL]YP_009216037.1 hypothetical protein AVV46_gp039 [Bacillus phage Shanette]AGR46730.1 hypothetical protein JL_41 [Bacillus phage JL]AGR46941.1 hypothetical protein SHANETTE_39 [Bacillus phage Shanette]